ncbi:MAG: hypothetical protein J6K38_06240 [Alistipes sp.]|nr:hypothetical protein [Alistipes sp.]
METKNKNVNILIVALAALLFILGIWGPIAQINYTAYFMSVNKTVSIAEMVDFGDINWSFGDIISLFLIFGVPAIIIIAAAIRAFKQAFYPQVIAWICRIAAIAVAGVLIWFSIEASGNAHIMLYVDILLAIAIAVLSFIFHKPARE